jgi:acyl-CoA reductase-like NAD-dependent aldehyde dehydrogenase
MPKSTLENAVSVPIDWKRAATAVHWNVQPFINGHYRPSSGGDTFDHINPATEDALYTAGVGAAADIADAVRVARRRFDEGCWSEITSVKRAEILVRLADLIVRNKTDIALLDSLEMGKPIRDALYDAEHFAPALLRSWAGFADKLLGVSAPLTAGTLAFNCYEPRGVVGAITPWNFPVVNAVYKIGPALAAGNTLVLKPSELSPSSALKLAELALEAGVPEGVFNVVPGRGATAGAALALHPDVNMLSFTGSTATGRKLMELSARSNGKPLLLECGGKSPQVVFDDADDLAAVAEAVVASVLWNQGQVCSAHTRLLVQESIKGALLEAVCARARTYHPRDPLDERTAFGPLASPAQRDRVRRYIEMGIAAGAVPVLLGTVQETGGCFVSPTIFDSVSPDMTIVREEIFGPVLCVQEFRTEEEAIALANGTDYGLVASVWTRDMARGRRLAHAIRAGYITVRSSGKEDAGSGCVLSHEPQKASGFGSEAGIRGLESYSTLKAIHLVGG